MRLWIASLLVGAGCNQIFGTGEVHLHADDAGSSVDASPFAMVITGMAFNSANAADPKMVAVTYPVVPGVSVEIGAMAAGATSPLPALSPLPIDATGTFEVPHELALAAYRIVYRSPGTVPVEYQTTLHGVPGHFIIDVDIGRPERTDAPANAKLVVGPPNAPDPYTAARLIETGSWATHDVGAVAGGAANAFTTAWSTSVASQGTPVASQAGVLSSPETGKGERLLLVDAIYPTSDNGAHAGLANSYSILTLDGFNGATANNLTATPWTTVPSTAPAMIAASYAAQPGFALAAGRVNAATRANGPSDDDNQLNGTNVPFVWSGVIPSAKLPNFVASGAGGRATPPAQANGIGGIGVPTFAFMSTRVSDLALPYVDLFNGTIAPKFPQAIFARVSRSRLTNNVKVTEGIQTISLTEGGTAKIDLAVGQAYSAGAHMRLHGTEIWAADSISAVVPRAPQMAFTFGVDGVVDDCVATLYTVTPGAYVPIRRYLMPATPNQGAPSGIIVDGSLLVTNQDYVFGVVCHLGYPDAVNGDWAKVAYPFSESTVYSFPFVLNN